jgi:hypothetical protein
MIESEICARARAKQEMASRRQNIELPTENPPPSPLRALPSDIVMYTSGVGAVAATTFTITVVVATARSVADSGAVAGVLALKRARAVSVNVYTPICSVICQT